MGMGLGLGVRIEGTGRVRYACGVRCLRRPCRVGFGSTWDCFLVVTSMHWGVHGLGMLMHWLY